MRSSSRLPRTGPTCTPPPKTPVLRLLTVGSWTLMSSWVVRARRRWRRSPPKTSPVVLQISPSAAAGLVADALDLRHRLPHLWRAVMRLTVPAWLARRVAQQTRRLPKVGARYVDETLAARSSWGTGVLDRIVADAIARFDPVEHQRREDRGKGSWDVKLTHPGPTEFAGTSELWARGDSVALQALYDLICAQAHQRRLDGDPDPLGARKVKALAGLER